jgi:hypothetical protein
LPYALSNLVDGQIPDIRAITHEGDVPEGAVVVQDGDMRDGWVWDAANSRLRPLTEEEELQQELDQAKYDKQVEFFVKFLETLRDQNPQVVGDLALIDRQLLDQGILSAIFSLLQGPAKAQELGAATTHFLERRSYVQSMTLENSTPEDVRNEPWG